MTAPGKNDYVAGFTQGQMLSFGACGFLGFFWMPPGSRWSLLALCVVLAGGFLLDALWRRDKITIPASLARRWSSPLSGVGVIVFVVVLIAPLFVPWTPAYLFKPPAPEKPPPAAEVTCRCP